VTDPTAVAARLTRTDSPAWWALAAVVAGGIAAGLATLAPLAALAVVGAVVALATVALIFYRPQIGILLIILTVPLDTYGRVLTKPVLVTVYQLVLVVTLASWAWRLVAKETRYRPSPLDLGIGMLLLAAVWSWPLSLDRTTTTIEIIRLAFLWGLAAVSAHYLMNKRFARLALSAFLVTVAGVSLLALAQYVVPGLPIGNVHTQVSLAGEQLSRVAAFFYDPNYLAGFLSVGVTTAAAVLVHSRRARVALSATAVLVLSAAALIATYSRTGWIGALIGIVAVVLTAPRRRRVMLVVLGLAVVLIAVAVAPGAITSRFSSILDYRRDMSNATRVYMIGSALQMARDNWQSGTGLGAFAVAYPAYKNPLALGYILKPHEVPLALAAETGVAGVVAVFALLGGMVWVFFVSRRGRWTTLQSVALAGVLALMVQSLFQYNLYFEYFWLFAALGVAAGRLSSPVKEVVS